MEESMARVEAARNGWCVLRGSQEAEIINKGREEREKDETGKGQKWVRLLISG